MCPAFSHSKPIGDGVPMLSVLFIYLFVYSLFVFLAADQMDRHQRVFTSWINLQLAKVRLNAHCQPYNSHFQD